MKVAESRGSIDLLADCF